MILLAIDPGPEESALVWYDTDEQRPVHWKKLPNGDARSLASGSGADLLAVEMIASYGMPVGADVFQTCVEIGRFLERWVMRGPLSWTSPADAPKHYAPSPLLVYRKDVKLHLCGSARAKDPNVRQALIDRFGPGKERAIGRKATPGPLYGLTGDCWAALGVAVTAADAMAQEAAHATTGRAA